LTGSVYLSILEVTLVKKIWGGTCRF